VGILLYYEPVQKPIDYALKEQGFGTASMEYIAGIP
jgi:hypothetical protein